MKRPNLGYKWLLPGGLRIYVATLVGLSTLTACKGKGQGEGALATSGTASSAPPSASAPAAPPKQIALVPFPVRIGDKTRGTRKSTMKLAVEFWQEGQKLGSNDSARLEEYTRTVEVLGIVGGAAAKVRTRYEQYHLTETHADKPPVDVSMLSGRSYVLAAGEKVMDVKDEHGKPVTPAEDDTLKKLHVELGQEDPLVTALGPGAIPIGKSIALRESLFRAFVGTGNGEFKSGTATLSGAGSENGRQTAIFDWTAEMSSSEENGLEITWHLKGQAVLAASPAMTLRASVEAALDVGGHSVQNGALVNMQGDGVFKDERTVTPLAATP